MKCIVIILSEIHLELNNVDDFGFKTELTIYIFV